MNSIIEAQETLRDETFKILRQEMKERMTFNKLIKLLYSEPSKSLLRNEYIKRITKK